MPGEDLDATVSLNARVNEAGSGAYGETDHLAEMQAQQAASPWAGGKVTLSTPGTPFTGSNYTGDSLYYPPPPAAAPMSRDQAMRMVMEEAGQSYAPPPSALSAIEARMPYSDNVASRLSDPSAPWNAPPPRPDPLVDSAVVNPPTSRYASYEEASQAKADILADAKNLYASSGRFTSIGSEAFNGEVQEALVAQGLAEPEGSKRGGGHQGQMGYALGGGILELAGGASHLYEEENSGKYLTPEQQTTAGAGLLPGVGGVIGAVAGMAIGNPMVGGLIGAGVGGLAQGVITAGDERGQATRQSAEELVNSLGEASTKVREFSSQIEASGATAQQFQAALGAAGGVGTFGAGTVAGVGSLTATFGEYSDKDWKEIAAYTANPLMHGMGNRFSTGAAGSGDLESLGFAAAEQGDFGGLKTFQQAARDARGKNDPEVQRLTKSEGEYQDSWWYKTGHFIAGIAPHFGLDPAGHDAITNTQAAIEARKAQLGGDTDPVAQAQNVLINQFADLKDQQIVAESGVGVASSGIRLTEARGGGAAQIGAASEGLYGSLGAARAATQGEIGLLQADLANPLNGARADDIRAKIAEAQTRLGGYDVAEAQQRKSVFDTGMSEEEAGFSFFADRATLSGRSAASMLSGYDKQAAYLSGVALDPHNPLSPTERAGIEDSALKMRYTAANAVYQEENAGLDITRAQRAGAVERADFLGTPGDVYGATIAGLQTDRDQIAQNDSEIRRGNLTNDQVLRLRKQNTDLQTDLAVAPERARISAYDAEEGILGDTRAADRSQLARNVSINGSSAYGPGVFADDQAEITHLRGAEDSSPVGSVQRARFGRARAGAEAALLDDTTQSQLYRETSAERTQDTQIQGAYRRSQISPWMDGSPDGDPLTRRNAELGNLQSRLTGAQRALDGSTDPLAREQNSARVEDYKDQIAEIEHDKMFAIERLLPEMIAGAGGRGTLAGVLPTKGQAAFYNANPYVTGSWGPAPRPAGAAEGGDHPQIPGGAAGRFLAAHGGAPNDDPALALLARIANSLESLKTLGGRTPANLGGASGGFNAQRPRNTD